MNYFGYGVFDNRTGRLIARFKTRVGAGRSADRRDNEYGAYRYSVKALAPDETKYYKRKA